MTKLQSLTLCRKCHYCGFSLTTPSFEWKKHPRWRWNERMNHFSPFEPSFCGKKLFVFCVRSSVVASTQSRSFALEFHTESIIELAHDEWKLNYGLRSPDARCFASIHFAYGGLVSLLLFFIVERWLWLLRGQSFRAQRINVIESFFSGFLLLLLAQSVPWAKERINYKHPGSAVVELCSTFHWNKVFWRFCGLKSGNSVRFTLEWIFSSIRSKRKEKNNQWHAIIPQLESPGVVLNAIQRALQTITLSLNNANRAIKERVLTEKRNSTVV